MYSRHVSNFSSKVSNCVYIFLYVKKFVINLGNGLPLNNHRTQFIKRMIEFSDKTELIIRLAYYPPYDSKYNPDLSDAREFRDAL